MIITLIILKKSMLYQNKSLMIFIFDVMLIVRIYTIMSFIKNLHNIFNNILFLNGKKGYLIFIIHKEAKKYEG